MKDEEAGLSIVMAAYKDGERLAGALPGRLEKLGGALPDWECILVDDHSPDDTLDALLTLRSSWPDKIRIARMSKNSGQVAALLAGIGLAGKKWVLCFDVDSVSSLTLVPDLVSLARDGRHDLVNWSRGGRMAHGLLRGLGSKAMAWLANRVTGTPLRDPLSPIKLIERSLALSVTKDRRKSFFPAPLLVQLAKRPVETDLPLPRHRDKSAFGPATLLGLASMFMAAYFTRLAAPLAGLTLALAGLGSGLAAVTIFLFTAGPPPATVLGWSFTTLFLTAWACLGLLWLSGSLILARRIQHPLPTLWKTP